MVDRKLRQVINRWLAPAKKPGEVTMYARSVDTNGYILNTNVGNFSFMVKIYHHGFRTEEY